MHLVHGYQSTVFDLYKNTSQIQSYLSLFNYLTKLCIFRLQAKGTHQRICPGRYSFTPYLPSPTAFFLDIRDIINAMKGSNEFLKKKQ